MSHSRESFRPTRARVDLEAVAFNYRLVRAAANPAQIWAVVKADGYGHGAVEVARRLAAEGCSRFAVSNLDEALELRHAGVEGSLLLLFGAEPALAGVLIEHRLVPLLSSLEAFRAMEAEGRHRSTAVEVHADFDTGMGRMGLFAEEAGPLAEFLRRAEGVRLTGTSTHFARAGESGDFTGVQIERFDSILATLRAGGVNPGLVHAANSAAALVEPRARYDAVRAGIALYGVSPEPGLAAARDLRPAMEWSTDVLLVRELAAGSPLSYGASFVTRRRSLIATLPVGYADGFRRALSNRGEVIVGGRRAPVVGRVCMDLTLVDVTDIPGVRAGDEAVLLGRRGDVSITVEEMAERLDTIGYEVLCALGCRVPRHYDNSR